MLNGTKAQQWRIFAILLVVSGLTISVFQNCAQGVSFHKSDKNSKSDSNLTLAPAAAQISYGDTATFTATGGKSPYFFQAESAKAGTLVTSLSGDSVVYTAASSAELVSISVMDADGNKDFATIVVQDASTQKGTIQGLVSNAVNGAALSGVSVTLLQGSTAISSTTTSASGSYSFTGLNAGAYRLNFVRSGFISIMGVNATVLASQVTIVNQSMSPVLVAGSYRIVLTWTSPRAGGVADVDAYLQVPGRNHPICWSDMNSGSGEVLDTDDVNWVGPETITISSAKSGTYIYYVNNYDYRNNIYALGNSSVHVDVYQGSLHLKSYNVPPGIGITYEVFRIVNGSIVDIGAYNSSLFVEPY